MTKLSRWKWELISGSVVLALGSLNHFIYEWSGNSEGVKWFAASNESVFEHMKLAVWPFFLMTFLMHFLVREEEDVWFGRTMGFLLLLLFIPLVFYLYTSGHDRESILAVDILTFVFAVTLGHLLSFVFSKQFPKPTKWKLALGITLHLIVLFLFVLFSYLPPTNNGLFFQY